MDSDGEAKDNAKGSDEVSFAPAASSAAEQGDKKPESTGDSGSGEDQSSGEGRANGDGQWELGRRLVCEGAGGEEAAVREVMLDSVDAGGPENIILEGGPHFSAADAAPSSTAADTDTDSSGTQGKGGGDSVGNSNGVGKNGGHVMRGGVDLGSHLHPVDQAIILALCLDVSNSNPVDGLTNEQMQPYVERVLGEARNWMIHSTALLQRSWLEFERRKTADRAMLQIQALIDQHTTKLTVMQSTYKSIEDSAPVQDRLQYLYGIAYPSQCELKRDLAHKYLRCQVVASALAYFRELELWDEVVTCYQLMSKPHRAELVVREQLRQRETPYMLTSLADLTGKEELYHKAWELSNQRYPRSMRTLAKICHDRGDFAACVEHMDRALSVHPLVPTAWYLRGIACMRLERWDDAVDSFVRCVQQDMELGEAWANIGAIHMRQRSWAKAYHALTEALKHKRDSWKILENIMAVTLAMGRWKEVVLHMTRLLDMRYKSERPVHVDELRHLCYVVSCNARREWQKERLRLRKAEQQQGQGQTAEPDTATSNAVSDGAVSKLRVALQHLRMEDEDEDDVEDEGYAGAEEVQPLPTIVLDVQVLLDKITKDVKSDPEIWDVCADFQHNLGRIKLEMDCRTRQVKSSLGCCDRVDIHFTLTW